MTKKFLAAGAIGVLVVVGVGAGTWMAIADGGESTERGSCAPNAYELSVEKDDGALELSYELQAGAPGQTWQVRVSQGDTVVLEGERTTDEDAELDLDALVDEDGADRFEVVATPARGEPCVAVLTR